MKKIPSLFLRENGRAYDAVTPGCEWVADGEGVATRKWDGTACLVKDGVLYKRYDAKNGKTPPAGFIPAQEPDLITGHWPGWLAIGDGPDDKWHQSTWRAHRPIDDGTYELCGPKVQGNPERFMDMHILIRHGEAKLSAAPRTFKELCAYLIDRNIEGIVWHHPDGRMCKLRSESFGIKRRMT